ncbi:transmembrane protein, putative (macronuclear) [Tetrahymena thermophila SB210]|uniref:Transmembrane protein, putative n=1 Tax=Tetrahymena thermophila (strain SB210) TaxID=312017 RepID=W7WZN1_TETTS|nr:transmembrane protein, putative [Tetrahymena thermophila SB210]EWS72305.1 transmembrane protein, putative [Tetrahymena thermophila SB210]|eukprot:XP_012655165.1 transmembrane protein, putative [Tetrahymena thermophila SB210]
MEVCTLCMDGFTLQQNACIVNVCENYQFYDASQSNSCVSLCNQNTIGVYGQNTCQQSSSCSKRFIQSSQISSQQSIQQVQYYIQNTIITIFTNFFNIIDAKTGAFLRAQTFNQNIILIKSFNNTVYMFSNKNQIFQWISTQNQMALITTAQQGIINSQSNIIQVNNNQSRLFFSSFDNQGQQIIFSEINQNGFNSISLKYDLLVTIIKGIIVLQNNQYQVMLINLVEQTNNIIGFNNITTSYKCNSIQGGVTQLEISVTTQTYFLLFQNTNAIVYFSQQNQQCSNSLENSMPLKIQLIQINSSLSSSGFNQLLLASFASNQFKIYNPQNQVSLFEIKIDNQIIDFNSLLESNNSNKIYFLKQNKIIDVYVILFDQSTNSITLNKINSLQSLISNPMQLITIQQAISSQQPIQIGVIGQDIQLIDISQDNTQGITVNYQEVANYNQGQINKLYYAEEINLSISCSQDGKLVVWKQVDPLNPQFYYQVQFPNQSCIDAIIFQSRLVVSLFSNQIYIFNIFNQYINQSIPINNQQQSGINICNNNIFLFFNQQIQVMTDINQVFYTFQIPKQAQNVFYSASNDIYILDKTNTITAYSFSNGSIQIKTTVTPYQFQVPLVKSYLFDLDNGDVRLMVADTNNQITILNSQLNLSFPLIKLDGVNRQIYQYNSTLYFVLLFAPNKNKSYPFAFECIDLSTTTPSVLNVHQVLNCVQIVYVKKQMNNPPELDYYFYLTAIVPMGYTSIMIEVTWNKKLQNNVLEKFIYYPNQSINIAYPSKGNTLIMSGTLTGYVGVVPYNKQGSMQNIFSLPTLSNGDQIKQVYYSFKLGLIFIQAQNDVYLQSIFTLQQTGKLSLANVNGDSYINGLQFSDISKIFVFYTCFIDDKSQQIIVYGDSLVQYDFTLSNQKVISTPFQQNYTQCIFLPNNVMCIMNNNYIQFFNRGTQLVSTMILKITSMNQFSILGDNDNQFLYVYQNMIEVYTFQGVIKQTFTQMNMYIFQLQFSGLYIVAYTSSTAYIISRTDLSLINTFQPSGSSLMRGFYFSEINMIAYITNEIRFGQIKFYNLNNFQALGSLTNQFTQNQVGIPVEMYYDADNSMINYIDQYGNQQLANFGAQINTYNMIAIPQMQQQKIPQPTDMITNSDMNEDYIYNPQGVWRVSNSLLLKVFQNSFNKNKQLYILMNTQYDSTQNNASMVFVDNNNNLFNYQNFQVTYITAFNNQVSEMRVIYQQNTRFNILVFSQSIIFFVGENVQFSNISSAQTISNTNLRKFLYSDNGYAIFQTYQNEIVDYNFSKSQKLYSFTFDQNSMIQDVFVYINPLDLKTQFLYFSTSTGMIYAYDMVNKKFASYSLFSNQDVVMKFVLLNYPNISLLMKSGNIVEVDCTSFTLQSTQNLNNIAKNFQLPISEVKTQNIPMLYYDNKSNYFYLSIAEEKQLGVFRISDNQLVATLGFPQSYKKSFNITNKYIILGCPYQLNFYDRQFNSIGRFRRSIQKSINQIIQIFDDYFFIVQSVAIETIFINQSTSTIQLIDSILLQNPFIYYYQLIDNQSSIKIIGISQLGVFEERLSVGVFQKQAQSLTSQILSCSAQLSYQNIVQVQNDFYSIYTPQDKMNKNFYLSVMINNEIQQLNFLNQQGIQFILRPQDMNNNSLNIRPSSFSSITSNLYMSQFNLKFVEQGQSINFSPNSRNITLQNLTIQDQNIMLGTSINFQNNQLIQIINMNIENVNFQSSSTNSGNNQTNNSLFQFNGIDYILIEEMTIQNLNQAEGNLQFINAQNVKQFIIRKLVIMNSTFANNFIQLNWLVKLRIMDLQIIDCHRTQQSQRLLQASNTILPIYVMQFNGIQNIQIFNMTLQNNKEIQFIETSNAYSLNNLTYILNNDTFFIQNSNFANNSFPNQFNYDNQINLVYLQTSFIQIQRVVYQLNQGNIFISDAQQVSIDSSSFQQNKGVLGASVQFQNIKQMVTITNSIFNNNTVVASGGALYFENINSLTIDKNSSFINNLALIGGAIRIVINDQQYEKLIFNNQYINFIKCSFSGNSATIFGQDIASYPSSFLVSQSNNNQQDQQKVLYQGKFQDTIKDTIIIKNLQSGGNVYLNVQMLDEQGSIIKLESDKIQSKSYPLSIRNELQYYQIQIYGNPSDNRLEIKGESLISTKQFNSEIMAFQFNNIVFSANPTSVIQNSAQLLMQINSWHINYEINFQFEFRECIKGEIPVMTSKTITFCLECSEGTYSLDLISNLSHSDNQQISCKKCPTGASDCSGSQIILKQGYWRLNENTDTIVQCNQLKPEICDFNSTSSLQGCIEGHIGPLCETCDNFGDLWKGKTYSLSFSDYTCSECSDQSLQIVYIVLLFLCVFAYIYFSIFIFLNNYIYNSTCSYIRYMNILPFSKSSIQDESTFVIKQLINFLQISQVIYQINLNFIPQAFSFLPAVAGQPMGKIIVSSQCLYTSIRGLFGLNEEIKIRSLIYILVPFFFLIVTALVLQVQIIFKLFKINKYHLYVLLTILFFFFQPNSIQFLTSTMTCRQVGDQKYVRTSLILSCDDESYQYFQYYAVLPTLIFWVLCPLVILYIFLKDTNKSKNIDYCINKYKYGYYYLEYKRMYYYWEFIRIYYRIVLVLVSTLLDQFNYISQVLCIIIVFSYICSLLYYKPFQDRHLKRIELFQNSILIIITFLNLLLQIYSYLAIQVVMSILHYGTIIIMVGVIIKMKLFNSQFLNSRIIQCLIGYLLPAKIIKKLDNSKILRERALKLWKKIYLSKTLIRQQRIEEQAKKINFSIVNKSSQLQNYSEDEVLEGKDFNKKQMFTKSSLRNSNQDLIQMSTQNEQESPKNTYFQSKKLSVDNFKLLGIQTRSPSRKESYKFKSQEEKQLSVIVSANFPIIETSDFDELQKPRQIYNNKKVNEKQQKLN